MALSTWPSLAQALAMVLSSRRMALFLYLGACNFVCDRSGHGHNELAGHEYKSSRAFRLSQKWPYFFYLDIVQLLQVGPQRVARSIVGICHRTSKNTRSLGQNETLILLFLGVRNSTLKTPCTDTSLLQVLHAKPEAQAQRAKVALQYQYFVVNFLLRSWRLTFQLLCSN